MLLEMALDPSRIHSRINVLSQEEELLKWQPIIIYKTSRIPSKERLRWE